MKQIPHYIFKRIILCLIVFGITFITHSQNLNFKKAPSIGISHFVKDFPNAAKIFKLSPWGWNNEKTPGINGFYIKGLSNHVDFVTSLGICNTKYKSSTGYFYYHSPKSGNDGIEKILIDADARINYKLLKDRFLFTPYISTGIGLSLYNWTYILPTIPVGGGFQIKVYRNSFVYLQTLLDLGLINTGSQSATKENFNYSIGFSLAISNLKRKPTSHLPITVSQNNTSIYSNEKDTDGDGIPDSLDLCPNERGLLKYHGCPIPDSDGDGINDEQDSCPAIKGVVKYHGCPTPDSDGDGINDDLDSCPTIKGVAKYNGCPIPDSDGDGINDEEDSCKYQIGVRSNHGCPEIKFEIKEIEKKKSYFGFGKIIINNDIKSSLDYVVSILTKYPNITIDIQGYTDNIGGLKINKIISLKRADAVKNYFISKGINSNRMETNGYGMSNPIASNKTKAGRSQNRRVELHAK